MYLEDKNPNDYEPGTPSEECDKLDAAFKDCHPNPKFGWLALHNLYTAENIYLKEGQEDPGWKETAAEIVYEHREFITDPRWRAPTEHPWFNCEYYSDDFITLMEEELGDKQVDCSQPPWWQFWRR